MYKYLFFVILIFFLIAPLQVFAQERGFLGGPIVPCGIKSDPARSTPCTLCDFFVIARNIINFIFELILVIAPLFILWGGIMLLVSAGNPSRSGLGKQIITASIIGVLIAFLSWTILSTIFNNLINSNSDAFSWPWNEPQCEGGSVREGNVCTCGENEALGENYYIDQAECLRNCSNYCASAFSGAPGCCGPDVFQNGCGGGTPTINWCQRPAPTGSENWILAGTVIPGQVGDAAFALVPFLNCMYQELPNRGLIITSISSNALCSNPDCDTTQYDCGHTANSCHFGGTNCTGFSYAVDFRAIGVSVSCSEIRDAALACDATAWVNWEGNHIHVSIRNSACGCNESYTPTACP